MRITTTRDLPVPPEVAWQLLHDSRLGLRPRCPVFRLGTPAPRECALPDGDGGVGAVRECRSSGGAVRQRITVWEPPRHLVFHMESSDLGLERYVDRLADDFVLAAHATGTRVTRTTVAEIRVGACRPVRAAAVAVGLKSVHRFVFTAWRAGPTASSGV